MREEWHAPNPFHTLLLSPGSLPVSVFILIEDFYRITALRLPLSPPTLHTASPPGRFGSDSLPSMRLPLPALSASIRSSSGYPAPYTPGNGSPVARPVRQQQYASIYAMNLANITFSPIPTGMATLSPNVFCLLISISRPGQILSAVFGNSRPGLLLRLARSLKTCWKPMRLSCWQ
jgi:hypothetical protein